MHLECSLLHHNKTAQSPKVVVISQGESADTSGDRGLRCRLLSG